MINIFFLCALRHIQYTVQPDLWFLESWYWLLASPENASLHLDRSCRRVLHFSCQQSWSYSPFFASFDMPCINLCPSLCTSLLFVFPVFIFSSLLFCSFALSSLPHFFFVFFLINPSLGPPSYRDQVICLLAPGRVQRKQRKRGQNFVLKNEKLIIIESVLMYFSVFQLLKYDKEISAFHDVITEEEIHFPPRWADLSNLVKHLTM